MVFYLLAGGRVWSVAATAAAGSSSGLLGGHWMQFMTMQYGEAAMVALCPSPTCMH